MNPILKNILAFIVGGFLGGSLNMFIISNYGAVFPLPPEIDPTDMQSLTDNIHLLEFPHLFSVFLAHALGTLLGAFIAARFSASHHLKLALGIGLLFFMGGIAACNMLNWTPLSFSVLDLLFAYFPMAYLGWKLSGNKK